MQGSAKRIALIVTAFAVVTAFYSGGVAQEHRGQRARPREKTPFEQWIESQGVPILKGYAVDDVWKAKLGPWKRLGIQGAIVDLEGEGGMMVGFIYELAPGKQSLPEKHLYEGRVLVLSGNGEARFWYDEGKKVTAKWEPMTLFPLPMNTWHEFINTGKEPARLFAATNAPLIIDLFRDLDFVFNSNHRFSGRFNSETDYFKLELYKFRDPQKTPDGYALTITNIVPDVPTIKLYPAGHGVVKGGGAETVNHHFSLAKDALDSHIEEFQPARYERGHRHGPGANVLYLSGHGYTLMWPPELGPRPFTDGRGDEVIRVDWHAGTLFVPPTQWYHQHFNPSAAPARFIKVAGFGSRVYRLTSREVFAERSSVINWADEDPKIREIFETELKKNGVESRMPSLKELSAQPK